MILRVVKYGLSYPLLADTEASVSTLYGTYGEKNMYGRKYMGISRETFLIDKDGIVRKVWPKVKPDDHASEVLETIESLHRYWYVIITLSTLP